jgi:flagellar L-ring protein precursor FlgH
MRSWHLLKGVWGLTAIGLIATACAHSNVEFSKDLPPSYVYKEVRTESRTSGSLWSDGTGLFADRKARGLNDLVTINIVESSSASKKADTATGRQSTMDASIANLFGSSLTYNLKDLFGPALGGTLSPTVSAAAKNDFTGTGTTDRQGSLIATITARVVDILPNGNLLIESRKDITVNREKQILLLRGLIRPDDIASDNTILSSQVANAEIIYTGEGVVNDKQGQGWLVRLLDHVWPF